MRHFKDIYFPTEIRIIRTLYCEETLHTQVYFNFVSVQPREPLLFLTKRLQNLGAQKTNFLNYHYYFLIDLTIGDKTADTFSYFPKNLKGEQTFFAVVGTRRQKSGTVSTVIEYVMS